MSAWLITAAAVLADSAPPAVSPAGLSDEPWLAMALTTTTVELSGQVASPAHADVLARLATDHFPEREIAANLQPTRVADVDWQVLTLSAVFVLAETSAGRLFLKPGSLELDGIVDGTTDRVETRIARVESAGGPGFSRRVSLHDRDRSLSAATACDRMFRALGTDGIRFPFGATELRQSAHAILDRYVEFAMDCPGFRLLISGHTDSTGDEALNLYLSEERAKAVRRYLVDAGVDANRLEAAGKGSAEPLADNESAWGRSRNRRIEVALAP